MTRTDDVSFCKSFWSLTENALVHVSGVVSQFCCLWFTNFTNLIFVLYEQCVLCAAELAAHCLPTSASGPYN